MNQKGKSDVPYGVCNVIRLQCNNYALGQVHIVLLCFSLRCDGQAHINKTILH